MSNPLMLDPHHLWCLKHRYLIPNYKLASATMELFDTFVSDPRVMKEAGYDAENGIKGDFDQIPGIMEKHAPMCCFLGDAVVDKILINHGGPNPALLN